LGADDPQAEAKETEPEEDVTKPEEALGASLQRARIRALSGHQVPPLSNSLTGRPAHVDFYLPKTRLYIEAKGHLTFDAIRKMATLAWSTPRYYLYQHDDWDWYPAVEDWPEGALAAADALKIRDRAARAESKHLAAHPSRATHGGLYKEC
jgi:hypothetical protein